MHIFLQGGGGGGGGSFTNTDWPNLQRDYDMDK